jgi:hypothetical protein
VAVVLRGKPSSRDKPGAPDKTHDFDLRLNDGRMIALEVTSSTVPEVVAMWAAIDACDWQCAELTQSWSVSLVAAQRGEVGANVKRFRKEGPRWLGVLEMEPSPVFGDLVGGSPPAHFSAAGREAIAALRELQVHSASPIGTMTIAPRTIGVGTIGPGGPSDGSSIIEELQRAASANQEKLLRSSGQERHLFLWVDSSDSASATSMATFALPSRPPALDDCIDAAWVGMWMSGITPESQIQALWRWDRVAGWRIEQVPPVRSYSNLLAG